jgi:hypothetical protein
MLAAQRISILQNDQEEGTWIIITVASESISDQTLLDKLSLAAVWPRLTDVTSKKWLEHLTTASLENVWGCCSMHSVAASELLGAVNIDSLLLLPTHFW